VPFCRSRAPHNVGFRRIPDRAADDMVAEQLEAIMHRDLAGAISSDEKLNEELRVNLEELKTVSHRMKPEGDMKRRGSRWFARFLVAICIGVAGTLAWQSYGEATKQIIVTGAPELGWSPEAKQMIASAIQRVGWTTPAGPEPTAPTVASKAPSAASLDPAQVQQMVQSLATLRQTVEQMAAGQDELKRDIVQMHSALIDVLVKVPEPPRQPPAAAGRKPVPAQPTSSRAALPPSRPPTQPQQ
jgi:hypothetical protein